MLSAGATDRAARRPAPAALVAPSDALHALLWNAHRYLALLFFAVVLLHLAAALFHGLVRHATACSPPWRRTACGGVSG